MIDFDGMAAAAIGTRIDDIKKMANNLGIQIERLVGKIEDVNLGFVSDGCVDGIEGKIEGMSNSLNELCVELERNVKKYVHTKEILGGRGGT